MGERRMLAVSLPLATLLLSTVVHLLFWQPNMCLSDVMGMGASSNNNIKKLFSADRFLKDRSIKLSPYVDRLWMDYDRGNSSLSPPPPQSPPAKILLTSYGWNQPDQKLGLQYARSMRSRELLQAIVDHPWFDLHGWDDILSGKKAIDPSIRYYVFLDVETCFDYHYPCYGQWNDENRYKYNSDLFFGRQMLKFSIGLGPCTGLHACYRTLLQQVLATPLFRTQPSSSSSSDLPPAADATVAKLVYLECMANPSSRGFRKQGRMSTALALARVSVSQDDFQPKIDQGLPPPAIQPLYLSPQQVQNLETCTDDNDDDDNSGSNNNHNHHRPYLLTLFGSIRSSQLRRNLATLDNGGDILIRLAQGITENSWNQTLLDVGQKIMMGSKFVASPRGDELFSYRFTEILSAGAIPVVYANGWVLPLRRELIDWERECVVRIPERQWRDTEMILRAMSREERCRRRRRCYELYRTYLWSAEGVIGGIIEGLELVARNVTSIRVRHAAP